MKRRVDGEGLSILFMLLFVGGVIQVFVPWLWPYQLIHFSIAAFMALVLAWEWVRQ